MRNSNMYFFYFDLDESPKYEKELVETTEDQFKTNEAVTHTGTGCKWKQTSLKNSAGRLTVEI